MTNSFYYFFSATPQVLAAILALFGVFVIFKVQTIKSELLAFGQVINNRFANLVEPGEILKDDAPTKNFRKAIRDSIYKCIHSKDMDELKEIIDGINDENKYKVVCDDIIDDNDYNINQKKFIKEYTNLRKIINRTIYLSLLTAFVIIICLATIPLDNYIHCNIFLLNYLFGFVLVSVFCIFSGLIYILIKSLK